MFILIDSAAADTVTLQYSLDKKLVQGQITGGSGEAPLLVLNKLLLKLGRPLSDVSGVAVITGQGRFTATRLSVTLANVLSYALGVPVVAVDGSRRPQWLKALKKARAGVYALAVYSGAPHIGGRQKKRKQAL